MKFGVEGSAMDASPGVSIFFVVSFVFLVIFTLINMFTVILEKHYTKARDEIKAEATSKGVSNANYGLQSLWLDAFKLPSLHIIPSREPGNTSKHYTENGGDGLGRGSGARRAQLSDPYESFIPPPDVVSQEDARNESEDASGVVVDHDRHLFLYVGSTLALEMYRSGSSKLENNKENHAVLAIHDSSDRVTALNMLRKGDKLDIEWPEEWRAHNMGALLKVVGADSCYVPSICTTASLKHDLELTPRAKRDLTLHIFELVLVQPENDPCPPEAVSLGKVGGGMREEGL